MIARVQQDCLRLLVALARMGFVCGADALEDVDLGLHLRLRILPYSAECVLSGCGTVRGVPGSSSTRGVGVYCSRISMACSSSGIVAVMLSVARRSCRRCRWS